MASTHHTNNRLLYYLDSMPQPSSQRKLTLVPSSLPLHAFLIVTRSLKERLRLKHGASQPKAGVYAKKLLWASTTVEKVGLTERTCIVNSVQQFLKFLTQTYVVVVVTNSASTQYEFSYRSMMYLARLTCEQTPSLEERLLRTVEGLEIALAHRLVHHTQVEPPDQTLTRHGRLSIGSSKVNGSGRGKIPG